MQINQPFVIFSIYNLCSMYSMFASVFHDIDTTQPLKCTFSLSQHNRVMVVNGRVLKIISPDERLSIRMEEESGQAFIYVLEPILKPTTLSVVTKNGFVQDLEVAFEDKSLEVVILKEPTPTKEEKTKCGRPENWLEEASNNIQTIIAGNIPEGYEYRQMDYTKQLKLGITATTVKRFENDLEIIYVYDLKNSCKGTKSLCEKELEFEGVQWVYLNNHRLKVGETVLGMVSVRKFYD